MRSCHNTSHVIYACVCFLWGMGEENVRMLRTYLSKLLLTAMIINELQASAAITSKEP